MRWLIFLIVLSFPIVDLYITMDFANWTGIPVGIVLLMGILLGVLVIQQQWRTFRADSLALVNGLPVRPTFLESGRKLLAASLFLSPGILSDSLGFLLLFLPSQPRTINQNYPHATGHIKLPKHAKTPDGKW